MHWYILDEHVAWQRWARSRSLKFGG